jgi:DNA-binding transcriptional MerR regulator
MAGPKQDRDLGYGLKTAAKVSGLSAHMLNYFCRHGIVEPSGGSRRGRGVARRYSFEDILLLRIIERLLAQGISPLRLKDAIRSIQQRGRSSKELILRKFVATDGCDIFLEDEGVIERLSSGQLAFAFVLKLDALRGEVAEHIHRVEHVA